MRFKIKFNSPAILTFAALCLAVMLVGSFSGGLTTELVFMTYHSPLNDPATYLRFFTHVLGHMDWNHFTSNMIYILLLGPLLEEKYGSKRIVQIIIITAFATGIINYLFFWNVALCGASGICFAFILLSSFTRSREGEIPVTFILVAAVFLGQQIYEGIVLDDDISNMAHIIGGIIGSAVGFILNKRTLY